MIGVFGGHGVQLVEACLQCAGITFRGHLSLYAVFSPASPKFDAFGSIRQGNNTQVRVDIAQGFLSIRYLRILLSAGRVI